MKKNKDVVFFVDDDPLLCREISEAFADAGFRICCFVKACDCLNKLHSDKCNLLITDYKLPDMNGLDFTRDIKQLFPWLPVLVITGYGNVQLAIRTIQAGAEDFLEKPFNIRILIEKVKLIIRKNSNENNPLYSYLTTMERQIFGLISSGKNNKEIAYFLNRSRRTVENHRAHLMKKFNAHNIEELIRNVSLAGAVRELK